MSSDFSISQLRFAKLSVSDSSREYDDLSDWAAKCEKCEAEVVFDRRRLHEPQACPKCGERYYRALCVEGDHYVLISNETLLRFSNNEAINCPYPGCGFFLVAFGYPSPEVRYESLNIVTWEEDSRRKDFRNRAHQRIPPGHVVSPQTPRPRAPFFPVVTVTPGPQDDRKRFEEYHFTTGARLIQAQYYLLNILKEYDQFSVEKSHLGEGLPEFIRHDLMLRGFVMNLRSALDVICQEVLLYYAVPVEEWRVDFEAVRRDLSRGMYQIIPAPVSDLIHQLHAKWAYAYLNRLRNVLEHRRAPVPRKKISSSTLMYIDGSTELGTPATERQWLADDPESPSGTETFELHRELCSVGQNLLLTINDFILRIYDAAQ